MTTTLEGEALLDTFRDSGALLDGHFRLSSGLHSAAYLQCALLLSDTERSGSLGAALAAKVPADWKPDMIVAPAMGGVIIGHETARAMRLPSIFTERKEGVMELRRGFQVPAGSRVIVVEDVVTTGKSTREVVALLHSLGAEVVGALSIVVRSAEDPELGAPLRSLVRVPVQSWEEADCPLCREGRPVVRPGSRPG